MELFSYTYSYPYVLCLLFLFLLMFLEFRAINENRPSKNIKIITVLGLMFFIGFRGFIYSDCLSYYRFFDGFSTLWNYNKYDTEILLEPGFVLYTIFLKSIVPDYFFYQIICTLIDLLFWSYFFNRYMPRYFVMCFICLLVFDGLGMEINLLRNIKSIILFAYSLKYVEQKSFIKYEFTNLLGILFHVSSIIYLPLYFILRMQFSTRFLWVVFIVGNMLYLFHISYIIPFIQQMSELVGGRVEVITQNYVANDYYSSVYQSFSLRYFERVITFVLISLYYKRMVEDHKSVFANLYILYFISYFYLSEAYILTQRVPVLFILSVWIIYPYLYSKIRSKQVKTVMIFLFMLYGCMKMVRTNQDIFSKYNNILFGVESYEYHKAIFDSYLDAMQN